MRLQRPSSPRDGKVLVPLLGMLAVLAIGVAGVAIVLQMQERDKRIATEQELVIVQSEKADVEARLGVTVRANTEMGKELALAEAGLLSAQQELEVAITAQEALQKSVKDRQKEISRLTKDLEQVRQERKQLALELGDIRSSQSTLEGEVKDLRTAKSELEDKVLDLADRPIVELDKIVVSEDESLRRDYGDGYLAPVSFQTSSVPEGEIIVVNREYDFVVMNIGKNQGLTLGQEFQILRGSEILGRVKVEKLYEELSAAAILPDSDKSLIREGDTVRAL